MIDLTLAQCFGVNVSQDSNSLIINKSDLPGLTPTTNNNAESLVVGVLFKIIENFEGKLTNEFDQPLTDELGNSFTFNQGDFVIDCWLINWRVISRKRNGNNYKVYQLVLHQFELY